MKKDVIGRCGGGGGGGGGGRDKRDDLHTRGNNDYEDIHD